MKLYDHFESSTGVCTDTRKIEQDCLFFALKGGNFNGNDFILDALKSGASHAVADEDREEFRTDSRISIVEDCLNSLQTLATHHRRQLKIPIIGITGSNGKTTTKELLHQALLTKFRVFSTPGNFNNHIGVPLSILMINSEHEIAILEYGDNHRGEVELLCKISEPTYCFLTNIGKDHIEGFGSFENNVLAKKELFDYAKVNGLSTYVDQNEPEVVELSQELQHCITFPSEPKLKYHLEGAFIAFRYEGKSYASNLVGEYNHHNIDAAFYISRNLGADAHLALQAIADYIPKNNRSQLIEQGDNVIYLDAYNANPSSMELALKSFAKLELKAKRVAIMGDMLELGPLSREEHQNILDYAKSLDLSRIILVGSEFSQVRTSPEVEHFDHTESLKAYLKKNPINNAQIMLKGSRGIKLESLLDVL